MSCFCPIPHLRELADAGVVAGDGVHFRDELLEVGVGKVIERELRDRARHLLRRLEVARVALRQRRLREVELEEHHRRRLVRAPSLQGVQPCDGLVDVRLVAELLAVCGELAGRCREQQPVERRPRRLREPPDVVIGQVRRRLRRLATVQRATARWRC